MFEYDSTYDSLKRTRKRIIFDVSSDHQKVNECHDQLISKVVDIAETKVKREWGSTPTPFAFFVMGSAGRFEQSLWSDQDHGIIYGNKDMGPFFQKLGSEISKGLHEVGYKRCEGNVMSDNPLWCQSYSAWEKQIKQWIKLQNWESIRHLLIFLDARVLKGTLNVHLLKHFIYQELEESPQLLMRMVDNTRRIKKGIGFWGHFLTETRGIYSGSLNLKETALFPYVNTVRLLAIKEKILETSTLSRFEKLEQKVEYGTTLQKYHSTFLTLLKVRLLFQRKNHSNQVNQKDDQQTAYERSHFIDIRKLTKEQKKELRTVIRNGMELHKKTNDLLRLGNRRMDNAH